MRAIANNSGLIIVDYHIYQDPGGSVAEWLACWTQAKKGPGSNRSCLKQTVHTHCASVHQAAKLVAAFLRVAGVTAGLAESNGSPPPGLWLTSPAGWLPRTGISYGTVRSVIEYGLPLHLPHIRSSHQTRQAMNSRAFRWVRKPTIQSCRKMRVRIRLQWSKSQAGDKIYYCED